MDSQQPTTSHTSPSTMGQEQWGQLHQSPQQQPERSTTWPPIHAKKAGTLEYTIDSLPPGWFETKWVFLIFLCCCQLMVLADGCTLIWELRGRWIWGIRACIYMDRNLYVHCVPASKINMSFEVKNTSFERKPCHSNNKHTIRNNKMHCLKWQTRRSKRKNTLFERKVRRSINKRAIWNDKMRCLKWQMRWYTFSSSIRSGLSDIWPAQWNTYAPNFSFTIYHSW